MISRSNVDIPLAAIAELCRRYHVRELSFFGSVVREDFHDDSDIDMLVEFEPDELVGFFTLSRMERELADILGHPVDLVSKRGLHPLIRQSVLESAVTVYAQ